MKTAIIALLFVLSVACSSPDSSAPSTVAPSASATATAASSAPTQADSRTTPTNLKTNGNNGAVLTIDCKPSSEGQSKVTFNVTGENLGTGTYALAADRRGGTADIQDGQIKSGEIVMEVSKDENVTVAVMTTNFNRSLTFGGCKLLD